MISVQEFGNNPADQQRQFLRDVLASVNHNPILLNIKTVVMSEIEMDSEFLTVMYELIVHIIEGKKSRDHDTAMQTLKQLQEKNDTDGDEADAELEAMLAKMSG